MVSARAPGTNECSTGPGVRSSALRFGSFPTEYPKSPDRQSKIESQSEELIGDKSQISSSARMSCDVVDGNQPSSTIDEASKNSSCSSQVKRHSRLFYQVNLMSTIKQ